MKKIKMNEIQSLEFEVFSNLVDYLDENSITYYAVGGTAIGALRHKGFIPWDDDIDIAIPRSDYDKLLKISNGVTIGKNIKILKPGDKNYIYPYSKACNTDTVIFEKNISDAKYRTGIFVDIFPIDASYNNKFMNFLLSLKLDYCKLLIIETSHQNNLSKKGSFKWIVKQCARKIVSPKAKKLTVEEATKKLDAVKQSADSTKNTLYVNIDVENDSKLKTHIASSFFSGTVESEFEKKQIKVPKEYNNYLTYVYGDYMKLPPESNRIFHGFEAYYTNE